MMMRFMNPVRTSLFDEMFRDPFEKSFNMMKTDVSEKDGMYHMAVDLPGYDKEDVKISLYNGTLKIEAGCERNEEKKDDEGNVIRRERYAGTCSRSFYVGEHINENDIHARFVNGVLQIDMPKTELIGKDEKKLIGIE